MTKVVYIGQFNDSSGYGNAARNYLKCFDLFLDDYSEKIQFKVMPQNFEKQNSCTDEENSVIEKYLLGDSYSDFMEYLDSDTKIICHLVPDAFANSEFWEPILEIVGKENIYSSLAWEPDRLPSGWLEYYQQYVGNVIVYCNFTKECFLSHGFNEENVHLIPHPIFDIESTQAESLNREKFEIFSMSQWHPRKGWDILIPAVCHEFFEHDDVELTIKTFRREHLGADPLNEQRAVVNEIVKLKNKINHYGQKSRVKINLVSGLIEKSQISNLFKQSTVYCLPTRCDSFGLTIGEAVISNRVAIVPSLGGHRDYFEDSNPMLVDSEMKPCMIDGDYFSTLDMKLVETDYTDLRTKLRAAYNIWKNDPDDLAQQAQKNLQYAKEEVINNEKIFHKFMKSVGVTT
jgi:glycosyltransferase involved in cell wall biosynthesis